MTPSATVCLFGNNLIKTYIELGRFDDSEKDHR